VAREQRGNELCMVADSVVKRQDHEAVGNGAARKVGVLRDR